MPLAKNVSGKIGSMIKKPEDLASKIARPSSSVPNISKNANALPAGGIGKLVSDTVSSVGGSEKKPLISNGANQLRSKLGLDNPAGISSSAPRSLSTPSYSFSGLSPRFDTTIPHERGVAPAAGLDAQLSDEQLPDVDASDRNFWGELFDSPRESSLDPQMSLIGNTPTNDAYVRDAIANGGDEDVLYDISHRDPWWEIFGDLIGAGKRSGAGTMVNLRGEAIAPHDDYRDSYDPNKDSVGLESLAMIDDGSTYDYAHMTSDLMTGTQYIHYVEDLGMPGRPIGQIDPTKIYSKRRENVNYGFTPFTPDSVALNQMAVNNVLDLPARIGSYVGGLRESITPDYTITYGSGDGRKTISGREFDRLSTPYINQMRWRYGADTGQTYEFSIPSTDGTVRTALGEIVDSGYTGDTFHITFSDGQTIDVDPEFIASAAQDDGTLNLDYRIVRPGVKDIPDLVMPDGTRIPYADVERLYFDTDIEDSKSNPDDDDISYGFMPLGLNRPSRLMQQELFTSNPNDERAFENLRNVPIVGDIKKGFDPLSIVDWTLGSIPISFSSSLWSPWVYSASNATTSITGADPATYNRDTDSYGLIAGYYDDDGNLHYGVTDQNGEIDQRRSDSMRFWNALGNAAVPLTENIAGNVGSDPFKRLLTRTGLLEALPSNPTLNQVIKHSLIDAAGEGIEEIIGNIFDEFTTYGPEGMFANQAIDENGIPMYDVSNAEIRNYDTPLQDRFRNFADPAELGNAFAGGVGVSAAMSAIPSRRFNPDGTIMRRIAEAAARDRARKMTGVAPFADASTPAADGQASVVVPPSIMSSQMPVVEEDDDDEYGVPDDLRFDRAYRRSAGPSMEVR